MMISFHTDVLFYPFPYHCINGSYIAHIDQVYRDIYIIYSQKHWSSQMVMVFIALNKNVIIEICEYFGNKVQLNIQIHAKILLSIDLCPRNAEFLPVFEIESSHSSRENIKYLTTIKIK
jgi:hypothetical protein